MAQLTPTRATAPNLGAAAPGAQNHPILCRACTPCAGHPAQPNPLILQALCRVCRVCRAFPRTRRRVQAGAHTRPRTHTRAYARSPLHTLHTLHKMKQINDLECAGHPAQAPQPLHSPETAPSGGVSGSSSAPAAGSDPDRENLAAFARRLGVNRSTVTRAAQAGRLVLDPAGRVCIAASLARWHATRGGRLDMADLHAAARGHHIPAVASVAGPATSPQPGPASAQIGPQSPDHPAADTDPATPGSRAFWEAKKLAWQNAQLLLALDLESGAAIPRQLLQLEATALGATLRATAERLVDQTAPRIAAATTPADRRRLLAAELAVARRSLLREISATARRLRPDHASSSTASPLGALSAPTQEPAP